VGISAHRLIFMLLLVSRLIFGEIASAMPDHGSAHLDHAASAQVSGGDSCPDHASNHDDNCCKSACSCPCVHFSALAAPVLMMQALLHEPHPQMPVIGATPGHVGRLLRPPA
jgi:hypothetical protein